MMASASGAIARRNDMSPRSWFTGRNVVIVLAAVALLAGSQPAGAAAGNCFTRVKTILTEQLGVEPEKVTPSANFIDDLGADKLDTVGIVMAAEEEFGIKISDADAQGLVTVNDLVAYLSKRGRCTLR
jgi:acyl carrier protein